MKPENFPVNDQDGKTAPAPLTEKQRMDKVVIGSRKDLKPGDEEKLSKIPEPVVKKAAGGTASSRADGCAQRGKTRGKMV